MQFFCALSDDASHSFSCLGTFFGSNVPVCLINQPQTRCSPDEWNENGFLATFWPNSSRPIQPLQRFRKPQEGSLF